MATGYTCISSSVRVDIDTLFAPLTGTKRADIGYKVNGSDISNLFEPSEGGDTIAFNTGFKYSGTDIATLFKALSPIIQYYLTVYSGSGTGLYISASYAPITASTAPTHYQFYQWIGSGITNINADKTTVLMDDDKIVSASYEPVDYTLTVLYGTGGGTQPYGYVYSITASNFNGFTFTNWQTNNGTIDYDNQNADKTTVTISSNAETEAIYDANDYTLTVVGGTGGGTLEFVEPDGATYHVTSSTIPTGYSFGTWTVTVGNSGLVIFGNQNADKTTVKIGYQNATISGSFDINQYTLSVLYGTGGGTQDYGYTYNIVADTFTGYTFTNWKTNSGTITYGDINDPTTTATIGAANASTEAEYDINQYTLTVTDGTGGGLQNYDYTYTINATDYVGYTFDEWIVTAGNGALMTFGNKNADTTTLKIGAQNATVESTYTINQYNLSVTYGTGGGTQDYGYTYNIVADTFTGYTFSNWQTNAGSITYGDINDPTTTATIGAANATTEAIYTANNYTLTVVNGSGGGTQAYTDPSGYVYSITADAPAEGYVFSGWQVNSGTVSFANSGDASTTCTIGAADATIEATYAPE
jgi:hypothetical protein